MHYYQKPQRRSDNIPGYVYLMEAIGYHGIFPGCLIKRCKIGLSRDPQLRLQNFHDNQPPCDIRIIRTIYVQDMQLIESRLHRQFINNKVKLTKSKEWFDFNPVQLILLNIEMDKYEKSLQKTLYPLSLSIFTALILISVMILAQATPQKQNIKLKPVQDFERSKNI